MQCMIYYWVWMHTKWSAEVCAFRMVLVPGKMCQIDERAALCGVWCRLVAASSRCSTNWAPRCRSSFPSGRRRRWSVTTVPGCLCVLSDWRKWLSSCPWTTPSARSSPRCAAPCSRYAAYPIRYRARGFELITAQAVTVTIQLRGRPILNSLFRRRLLLLFLLLLLLIFLLLLQTSIDDGSCT